MEKVRFVFYSKVNCILFKPTLFDRKIRMTNYLSWIQSKCFTPFYNIRNIEGDIPNLYQV